MTTSFWPRVVFAVFATMHFCVTPPLIAQGSTRETRRAEPLPMDQPAYFPETLIANGTSGYVRMTVVIDTTGRILRPGASTVSANRPAFALAVVNALPRWRFLPAMHDGEKVPDTLELLVSFRIPRAVPPAIFQTILRERVSPAPGKWEFVIGSPNAVAPATLSDSDLQRVIVLSVLDTLLAGIANTNPQSTDRIGCASSFVDGKPEPLSIAELVLLKRAGVVTMNRERCPKSFASMYTLIITDSLGVQRPSTPPPGEDPHFITFKTLQTFSPDELLANVDVLHGMSGQNFTCLTARDSSSRIGWKARCFGGKTWVH